MTPAIKTSPFTSPFRMARLAVILAGLGLAGCASTRNEAPPEVMEQPPTITAGEAVTEGQDSAAADDAADAAAGNTAAEAAKAGNVRNRGGPAPSPRYTPTQRSVEDVRSQNQATPEPLDFSERVDHLHDQLYTWVQGVVEATDHRFASSEKELKPVPAAPFRLGIILESVDRRDGVDLDFDVNLDIALRLPNIEDRLRLFVTSGELDESPRDARSESSLRAGVRYPFLGHFDFDLGIKLDLPPVAFVSVRWARQYEIGRWDVYPLAKLFAETDEGVGYVAAATFDRWSGRHLWRSSSFAKWTSDRDQIEWTQTLVYAHADELIVPDRYGSYLRASDIGRGWGVRLLASAGKETKDVDYFEAGVFYRRPTSNNWLFWFVEPLVRWDKQYDWAADPGIRVGIDMLFWDLARPTRH
ncbi:MAG: hypothetical protein RL030_1821 [Pseudomonadota bacterium]